MVIEYEILEMFNIKGRGTIVVINGCSLRAPGKSFNVKLLKCDGSHITTLAFKELPLSTTSVIIKKEAYLLNGVDKHDISPDSRLIFVE